MATRARTTTRRSRPVRRSRSSEESTPAEDSTTGTSEVRTSGTRRPKVTVEDLADFNESINLLIHGDSGVGKTPLAAMAPRAVILSTEKGSISAKRFGSTAKLIRATTWEALEAALDYLEAHPEDFDWVVLDSLTKMQQLLLRYLLGRNVEENRKNADIDLPQLQDHQKWQNMFKRFVDRIIDMEINTIFITTSMIREDAEGDDLVLPAVHGKDYEIAQYVCAQMDGIYYLKIVSPKEKDKAPYWRLLTQRKPPYFAKDRYRALPRVIEYPYMPAIIKAIEASIGDGVPLYPPEMMTELLNGRIAIEPDDIEDMEDSEDEPEARAKPSRRRRPTRETGASPRPARGRTRPAAKPVEPDEPEEDGFDPDDELSRDSG